jgi:RecA/RadA recombinase
MPPKDKKTVKDEFSEDAESSKVVTPDEQAFAFMSDKDNAKDHYNFQVGRYYRVSTGSLKLDILTGGGITPGILRLVGRNSGGKTSECLEILRNFLLEKGRRGLYVQAEGKFSKELQVRSGVKFVTHPKDWQEGTCLIYESNIFESVCNFVENLIRNNPTEQEYMFIVDSLDGLILRDDLSKAYEDSHKVAGPQVLGKKMMQKLALALVKFGHIFAFTSQVTAQPKIDPYAKLEHRDFASSGGNWALHYPENIWEFNARFQDDIILKDPNAKYNESKNPIIGHLVPITVRKSNNEKNSVRVKYPIRYGMTGGKSVWVQREVGDAVIAFYAKKKGSWIEFSTQLIEELAAAGLVMPAKIQGTDKLYEFLEENQKITDFLFEKFRNALKQEAVVTDSEDPLEVVAVTEL